MKLMLLLMALTLVANGFSQDPAKKKQIDSLAGLIDRLSLPAETDSIYQQDPDQHIIIKTVITVWLDSTGLKKYNHKVYSVKTENNIPVSTISSSLFFFYQHQLIKVEESMNKGGEETNTEWYYWEGQYMPAAATVKSTERAMFLLGMARDILKEVEIKK